MNARELKEAFEAIAMVITGEWEGKRSHARKDHPFRGPEDAIRKVRLYMLDGARGKSLNDPDRLKSLSEKHSANPPTGAPTDIAHRELDDILPAIRAIETAYKPMVVISGTMSIPAEDARTLLFWRYSGGTKLQGCKTDRLARAASRWLGYPITENQVKNVTTAGVRAVYRYLDERGLTDYWEDRDADHKFTRGVREVVDVKGSKYDLEGWAAIADHCEMSVNAVKRLVEDEGLPVFRIAGRIVASKKELVEWHHDKAEPFDG